MELKEKLKSNDILNLNRLIDQLTKYFELKTKIYELKVKEQLVDIISSFAALTLIVSFGMFTLFFFSIALGFYLNSILENGFLGFLIVGILYFLICLILILFKDKIITNRLFQAFFSDTLTRNENEQHNHEQD